MRILLLSSAFNGLTQRAWIELRRAGHDVTVELAVSQAAIIEAAQLVDPELIICPFLRERVPTEVWTRYRTIIVHPGPKGDRGPSSLDWAITDGETRWGVTALQAVEEMDAGPIWATRSFALPPTPLRKSAVYNGAVADAAIELIGEVVAKAADPTFRPEPLDYGRADVIGTLRPTMRQVDRQFSWSDPTATIVRRIAAADGSPGVRTTLAEAEVSVFDADPGPPLPGEPGSILRRHHDAVLVRTGDGTVWIGQVRVDGALKLPAAAALGHRAAERPGGTAARGRAGAHRRAPRDQLPPARRGRRASLRLLQRGDVDVAVPPFGSRPPRCREAADQSARRHGRRRVLQRHPPQRHPRCALTGAGGVAQHQRDRRRVPRDHHLHRPARRRIASAGMPAPGA